MASISSKVLFITTSPRTAEKMVPEIELLHRNFSGQVWNNATQTQFMQLLKDENFFNGEGAKDPAFSARDRINRGPKSLGFVTLSPRIALTPAGLSLLESRRREEVFLRQLLKFQLPSPYHTLGNGAANFWVKPYLEIFRLVRHFGSLRFDELMIYGMQLVDYRNFDRIVEKINQFRVEKAQHRGNYRVFKRNIIDIELREIYSDEINAGQVRVRENRENSIPKFLQTKSSNLRDYADACVRYLRSTGMVDISYVGKSISIVAEKIPEVDYFLENTPRNPEFIDNAARYIAHLGDSQSPTLLTDNRDALVNRIHVEFPQADVNENLTTEELKDIFTSEILARKETIINQQISDIKDYDQFDDISQTFQQITDGDIFDAPLMLEWNTWRAMTMLDGGDIKANLKFDDFGKPMSTAQGNMPDIVCNYGSFQLTVEVTLQSGQRQYETEGEPVARHLAKVKAAGNVPSYCLFVAPRINDATIAHFYALHRMNIMYYGGTSTIVPLPLSIFMKMVVDSRNADYVPEPRHIQRLFERSNELAVSANNEAEWYEAICIEASNLLVA